MEPPDEIVVTGAPLQSSGGLFVCWDEAPRGLVLAAQCCASPRCACRDVDVEAVEVCAGLSRVSWSSGHARLEPEAASASPGTVLRARLDLESAMVEPGADGGGALLARVQALCDRPEPLALERARRRKRRMAEIGERIFRRADDLRFGPSLEPFVAGPKPAPNDRCPCGSGKKYERCCGA